MKFFRNLNPKNEKKKIYIYIYIYIQPEKFIGSQIYLVKMSNRDLRVINEECNCQNINEVKYNENENVKCYMIENEDI